MNARLPFDGYHLLGVVSDRALAAEYGVHRSRIRREREARGIRHVRESRLGPAFVARLGTEPDSRIAAEAGVSIRTVRDRRAVLGIAPWSRHCERRGLAPAVRAVMTAGDDPIAMTIDEVCAALGGRWPRDRVCRELARQGRLGEIVKVSARPVMWVLA